MASTQPQAETHLTTSKTSAATTGARDSCVSSPRYMYIFYVSFFFFFFPYFTLLTFTYKIVYVMQAEMMTRAQDASASRAPYIFTYLLHSIIKRFKTGFFSL